VICAEHLELLLTFITSITYITFITYVCAMATAYLLKSCPYSFKLLLFISEAGLRDQFAIVTLEPESQAMKEAKQKIEKATGEKASFPTVEIEPGVYKSDSDELIAHFSQRHGVDPANLIALSFYKESIFPQLQKMH
jgi:hypothetical protein